MKVREIMKQPVVTVRADATLAEVARTMLDHRVWGVPVIDQSGEMCGIITEADFSVKEAGIPFTRLRAPQLFGHWLDRGHIEQLYEAARTMNAEEVMTSPVVTVTEDESIAEAIQLMGKHHCTRLPVVRGKIPVGMIARNDLLKLLVWQDVTVDADKG